MATNYREEDNTVDDTFFADAIESQLTEGKAAYVSASMKDYVKFYGSTRKVAEMLVDEGVYSNVKSAQRQVQRMVANPNLKVKQATLEKFTVLNTDVSGDYMISITGKFSYDLERWAKGAFDFKPTTKQLRDIIYAARPSNPNRNQDALNAFMDGYDVAVGKNIHFSFATGVEVEITRL